MFKKFTLFLMLALASASAFSQLIIQPKGEERTYVRTGYAFAPEAGSTDLKLQTQTGKAARVVFQGDTVAYLHNPISKLQGDVWVKGTLNADKTELTVPVGQVLANDTRHHTNLVLVALKSQQVQEGENIYLEYVTDSATTAITYNVTNTSLTLANSSQDAIIGVVYQDDGTWTGYGDFSTVYTLINDTVATLPAGLTPSVYTMYAASSDTTNMHRTLNVAITDKGVYVQGFSTLLPQAWAYGTFNDNKRLVTFPIQYMGTTSSDYPVYLARYAGGEAIDDVVLVYDSIANNFYISQQRSEPIMLENASKTQAGYYYRYGNLEMAAGADVAVTPPADATQQQYLLKSYTYGGDVSKVVNVAAKGDDIYLQGVSNKLPESWVKGTKTDAGYVVASPQFLGYVNDVPYYFISESSSAIQPSVTFAYTDATKAYSTSSTCAVSSSRVRIKDDVTYYGISLTPYQEAADAVPSDPVIDDVFPDDGEIDYTINPVGTNGEDLDVSKLSMVFYYDIERSVDTIKFDPADFPEFSTVTTVIPVDFESDNFSGDTDGAYMTYKPNDAYNRVGMQLLYQSADGITRSNIVWYKIKDYVTTGIEDIEAASKPQAKHYFTIDGKELRALPESGIVIVKEGDKARKLIIRK